MHTHKEYQIFAKYCYNAIDYDTFESLIKESMPYSSEGYTEEKWKNFQDNMFMFLASYQGIFESIVERMNNENYTG